MPSNDTLSDTYHIRPAARHILTIGQDLIQDPYAAIVELVKNCYDADSPDARIVFKKDPTLDRLEIRVEDHGHGMSPEDIVTKWLVPSTMSKVDVRVTSHGRTMQGRKGIGRYAASILGEDMELATVDSAGIETTIRINWHEFLEHQYLDEIQIPVTSKQTQKSSGTTLTMHSKLSENTYWNEETLKKLRFELKKLVPPNESLTIAFPFKIELTFDNFYQLNDDNTTEVIEPYPILDYYDYRIHGEVKSDGIGTLTYENNKMQGTLSESIDFRLGGPTKCGNVKLDIRVYDRDKDSIDQLIKRGLHDSKGNYVTKTEARKLLNDVNGIGVYRNGFRIRPLGDADFDWLKLNEQRVQKPSLKIGSNQVVGYVYVESEERSGLEEKSARDGLKNNDAYDALKELTLRVITELETRRFAARRHLGLTEKSHKIDTQLDEILDFSELTKKVSKSLYDANASQESIEKVATLISDEAQRKNADIEKIKEAVAVYQGQSTLGKIINIVLHEGRRPLSYFKIQIPHLRQWGSIFEESRDEKSFSKILEIIAGLETNANVFAALFQKLDPLAARRRTAKKEFKVKKIIKQALSVYENDFQDQGVEITLNCKSDLTINGWDQDLLIIFVNLLDNSNYWLKTSSTPSKRIEITVEQTNSGIIMNYQDSGPGIPADWLEDNMIFEPSFTTKQDGTGLGLSIALEAAARNDLTLYASASNNGAHFILESSN